MAQLILTHPEGRPKSIDLEGEGMSLGRSTANEMSFPGYEGLSRRHLVFEPDGECWTVRDLEKGDAFASDELHLLTAMANVASIRIEREITGKGSTLSERELARVFDPKFEVARGRVTTGNWSLFTARQLIRDQGGEINISSQEDGQTTISVTLPIDNPPA